MLPLVNARTRPAVGPEEGSLGGESLAPETAVTTVVADTARPGLPDAVTLTVVRMAEGRSPGVEADDPWAEAGRTVLRFHLQRMVARLPGVIDGEDAEDVHAMRVAARRMRAAWRVFGDGFEREAVRRSQGVLRDIGARLGLVRDLDVRIGILETVGQRRSGHQRADLEPLQARWRAEREARWADLDMALRSADFVRFIGDCEKLVATPGYAAVSTKPHAPVLVRDRMPATIWRAYGCVRAFDAVVEAPDQATLHELRIAAKWLRYTLESVREPLEPEATPLIRSVVALQDVLGDMHDQHAAGLLARSFLTSATLTAPQATSISRLIEHLEQNVDRLGRSLGTTWQPVAAPSYRRRLGRALARL